MAPLIPETQQVIAQVCAVSIVPIIAIPLALMLMRQLRWFGFRGLDRED